MKRTFLFFFQPSPFSPVATRLPRTRIVILLARIFNHKSFCPIPRRLFLKILTTTRFVIGSSKIPWSWCRINHRAII